MYKKKRKQEAIVSFYRELYISRMKPRKQRKKEILTSNLKQNRGANATRIRGTVRKMKKEDPREGKQ